jgi:hypothetical protein
MDLIPEHLNKAAAGAVLGVAGGLLADSMLFLNYGGWMFLFSPVIIAIPFIGGLLFDFICWKCLSFKLPFPAIFIAAIILFAGYSSK